MFRYDSRWTAMVLLCLCLMGATIANNYCILKHSCSRAQYSERRKCLYAQANNSIQVVWVFSSKPNMLSIYIG